MNCTAVEHGPWCNIWTHGDLDRCPLCSREDYPHSWHGFACLVSTCPCPTSFREEPAAVG